MGISSSNNENDLSYKPIEIKKKSKRTLARNQWGENNNETKRRDDNEAERVGELPFPRGFEPLYPP
jgi:hypothetical protein